MSKTKIEILPIDLIRIDGQTQARIKINEDAVDDYAEVIKDAGGDWPFDPIDVFFDGSNYFVADGFHRTLAAIRMKRASIPCRVHQGTAKDAKIFGMTANDTHGIRMTREDKRACVEWLLDYGGRMTQAEIAQKSGVTERSVRRIVSERNSETDNRTLSGSSKSSSKSSKAPKSAVADKLKKQEEKEAEKAKKKVEAAAAKAAKKAEADAARAEKKKQAEAERKKKKEDAAAAKAEAKEAARVAKEEADRQSRSPDEQAKLDCSVARQLIQKATRSVDDLNRTKKSPALGAKERKDIDGCIKEISGPSITRRMTVVRILQLAERLLWQ
jgi:hypothetical protein